MSVVQLAVLVTGAGTRDQTALQWWTGGIVGQHRHSHLRLYRIRQEPSDTPVHPIQPPR